MRIVHWLAAGMLLGAVSPAVPAQERPLPVTSPLLRDVRIIGANELPAADVAAAARVQVGAALPDTPERIARTVERYYKEKGYTFAVVTVVFDDPSGTLTLTIDEGVIDRVEFLGVRGSLAHSFADEFALRRGDVFNRSRAMEALNALLRPARGAIRPSAGAPAPGPAVGSNDQPRPTFERVERNGERVLEVGLSEPPGRVRVRPDFGDREDWFTPVDGFVPSLGFGVALFDHTRFNHAYVAGHVSYKTASQRAGYALGFEKPFFGATKLFLGGEVFDLSATDDRWRISSNEASVFAIGARHGERDYYERRGVQLGGAFRPHRQAEVLFAWRDEQHLAQRTSADFSIFNGDEPFRANVPAQPGRLNALLLGAAVDSRGFGQESLDSSYRRHQLENLFGDFLDASDNGWGQTSWRFDWTSEIASPDHFGGDFDFRRHVVNARALWAVFPHQELSARALAGWSDGQLPPQRLFAIGGIGSVRGYDLKEEVGENLALFNVEYAVGWRHGLRAMGFIDRGRVASLSSPDAPWLNGVGFGLGIGGARVEFGYPLDGANRSMHVVLRFNRTF